MTEYTREQILKASPSLLNDIVDDVIMHDRDKWLPPQNWSGDISAAWEVVEKVRDVAQAQIEVELFHDSRIDGRVTISDMEDKEDIMLPFGQSQQAGFPKTLTEAICKAALLAVMGL